MTQTLALFVDAYREMNARKMFWITLILSGLVVVAFALIGITEKGLKVMFWEIEFPINTSDLSPETFYKLVFVYFGIGFWLAWVAAILALISTASIFPDFIAGGSIDLVLSKPIGRMRLFLTKYVTGLMFVGLQVTVFSVASFVVIGLRGGAWEPGLLLAIPLVVCFFSYLFAVCVVIGLLTRSTVASLLLTLLFWFGLYILNTTDALLLAQKLLKEQQVETLQKDVSERESKLASLEAGSQDEKVTPSELEKLRSELEKRRERLATAVESHGTWSFVHGIAFTLKTGLPKTSETIALLERWLVDLAELPGMRKSDEPPPIEIMSTADFRMDPNALQRRMLEETRNRSWFWVIGTSLLFEVILLAFGGWRFCRRDF